MRFARPLVCAAVALLAAAGAARADINVGVTVSATGPAASLGIPERNTIAFQLPIVAQKKRDLDRLFSAIHAQDGTVPLPSNATIASLTAATKTLADAVAADKETGALINLAIGLGGIVAQIESA